VLHSCKGGTKRKPDSGNRNILSLTRDIVVDDIMMIIRKQRIVKPWKISILIQVDDNGKRLINNIL
jgi:hypothetical protein